MRARSKRVIGVATAVILASLAVHARSAADDGPTADCPAVLALAGGTLPAQATDVRCTDDSGWQDRTGLATFRMPREDLAQRLTAAFPRVRLTDETPQGPQFAGALGPHGTPPPRQAVDVNLKAVYEADGTARIELRAIDV